MTRLFLCAQIGAQTPRKNFIVTSLVSSNCVVFLMLAVPGGHRISSRLAGKACKYCPKQGYVTIHVTKGRTFGITDEKAKPRCGTASYCSIVSMDAALRLSRTIDSSRVNVTLTFQTT
jgi:hypothetical protein